MIVDLIKRDALLFRKITGHKPGRVYIGIKHSRLMFYLVS